MMAGNLPTHCLSLQPVLEAPHAQSGNQGEGRGRQDDQAEDGKMT